jgi:hypothetical protein
MQKYHERVKVSESSDSVQYPVMQDVYCHGRYHFLPLEVSFVLQS